MVQPGVAGQAIGDVRLLIPNSFKNGDTIDLAIFDRSAGTSNGQINADAAHKLGFTGAPTVTVDQAPYEGATHIGPTSSSPDNTEGTAAGGNAATHDTTAPATTPPAFTTSVVQSSRANGLATDIIRLTVNGVQAAGDTTDEWLVTLGGMKVDLGAAVSPGEIRVVPFAYNGAPSTTFTNASTLFQGNLPDDPLTAVAGDPIVNTYTVPAYVAPVTFNVGTPNNVIADGTDQKVGDIVIDETNNYSLQDGTYTVTIDGATVQNDDGAGATAPVKVTLGNANTRTADGGVDDEKLDPAYNPEGNAQTTSNTVSFKLNNASNTSKLSVKLSGLILNTTTQGPITYTLSGGSIDGNSDHSFLVQAGDSLEIPQGYAGDGSDGQGVEADSAFVTAGDVNQTDIQAPGFSVAAVATPTEKRIGGGDRYETAAKIALNNGSNNFVVLASGQNFPDALSSNYLAQQTGGGSILLTRTNSLPQATLSAMRQLGTTTVYVVGGPAAVSDKVVNQLKNTPQYYPGGEATMGQGKLEVIRLAGANRYETNKKANEFAAALFEWANPVGRTNLTYGESSKLTALLATGQDYADALALGPATDGTFRGNLPLILTQGNALSATAKAQLSNFGIEQVVIGGGTSAVSSAVESELTGMGIKVLRLAGADRYETATKVADFELLPDTATPTSAGGLGFDDSWVYLATGEKYADALAGGPLAGGNGSPIVLTRTAALTPVTQAWLAGHKAQYSTVVALGLGAAVSEAALDAANAAIS
jgi:putative cell wall-binding protein